MASIIKRKAKYSVVYNYEDKNGVKRQKWETCASHAEAKRRKAEIEHQQDTGQFIPPNSDTLASSPESIQQAPVGDPLRNLDATAKQQLLLKLLAESPEMSAFLTALAGRSA